jgi:hypothetical protein
MPLPADPYYYSPFLAFDLSANAPVANAAVQWFAEGDAAFATPLEVWDLNGTSLGTSVTTTSQGYVGDYVLTVARAVAKSGTWTTPVESKRGAAAIADAAKIAAQDSAASAAASATAAQLAQDAAEAASGIPPGGTTGQALIKLNNADFNVAWGDVATGGGGGTPGQHAASHGPTGSDPLSALAISQTSGLQAALDAKAAVAHTHTASQISDSTAAGRTLVTAADAAAQRTALKVLEMVVVNAGVTTPPAGTSVGAIVFRRTS